jgi:hypothetical protein
MGKLIQPFDVNYVPGIVNFTFDYKHHGLRPPKYEQATSPHHPKQE